MNVDDYNEFLDEFRSESDRAAVILAVSRLDLQLYHLIQLALIPNITKTDDLLDGDSPLSTFSSRINLCYRLGLIDADVTRALHLIRKIRNIFAHEASGSSLRSGSHRDRVRELSMPFNNNPAYQKFRDKHFKNAKGEPCDFRAIAGLLVLRLTGGIQSLTPLYSQHSVSLIPDSFDEPEEQAV